MGIWFLIIQIFWKSESMKSNNLVTYNLECDSFKLSQFVCAHFELRKKRVIDLNHCLIALRFTCYEQLTDQTLSLMKALCDQFQ